MNEIKPSTLNYLQMYEAATTVLVDRIDDRRALFRELVDQYKDKAGLQIGVRNAKFAPNWKCIDKHDESILVDYHYDIHHLPFPEASFDVVVCNAILEHVESPVTAIGELFRVLKERGRIWVEVPFNQPYHPSPNDYWRVTPNGLRIWMKEFREISCGFFRIEACDIYNGVFYYGEKEAPATTGASTSNNGSIGGK